MDPVRQPASATDQLAARRRRRGRRASPARDPSRRPRPGARPRDRASQPRPPHVGEVGDVPPGRRPGGVGRPHRLLRTARPRGTRQPRRPATATSPPAPPAAATGTASPSTTWCRSRTRRCCGRCAASSRVAASRSWPSPARPSTGRCVVTSATRAGRCGSLARCTTSPSPIATPSTCWARTSGDRRRCPRSPTSWAYRSARSRPSSRRAGRGRPRRSTPRRARGGRRGTGWARPEPGRRRRPRRPAAGAQPPGRRRRAAARLVLLRGAVAVRHRRAARGEPDAGVPAAGPGPPAAAAPHVAQPLAPPRRVADGGRPGWASCGATHSLVLGDREEPMATHTNGNGHLAGRVVVVTGAGGGFGQLDRRDGRGPRRQGRARRHRRAGRRRRRRGDAGRRGGGRGRRCRRA